jgi:hypothetical protein
MEFRRQSAELRRIREWYDQIDRGADFNQDDIVKHFRGYADQAAILIRRVKEGQTWDDFVMGIDGVPPNLLNRLVRQFRSH